MGQIIAVAKETSVVDIIAKLEENSQCPEDADIRYKDGKRYVRRFQECNPGIDSTPPPLHHSNTPSLHRSITPSLHHSNTPLKDHGVYLITGGAGGLGLIFAKEIAEKVQGATLILTGRSQLNKGKKARFRELENLGATVAYKSVDVCDKESVEALVLEVQTNFGGLNGIIHSAGVIRDSFILKKNKAEFEQVLAPKVTGVMNLDRATQALELDLFVLFSSAAGATGNVGQADYAAANAFMDAFAKVRNSMVEKKERRGQTLSINWPLWREGGIRVDEATEKMMKESIGMVPMETASGIKAFYQGLATNASQVMVMEGDLGRLYEFFRKEALGSAENREEEIGEESGSEEKIGKEALEEKAITYFKRQLSKVLKLPVHRIQAEEPFEKYGIDSVMAMDLTNQLEKIFGSLSKTLFFEYQTIQEVSGYFVKSYGAKLREILSVDEIREGVESAGLEAVTEELLSRRRPRRSRFVATSEDPLTTSAIAPLDIAIIGLSGRYPKARDLKAYWANLQEGKDCISEIPKDRWDWREYYSENRNQLGVHYSKWGGFIEDVDKFDPLFFNISPREATFMDPQERLFLETVWETLEDAGYSRGGLVGNSGEYLSSQVGVYAGVMYGEYQLFGAEASRYGNRISAGSSYASIANRVSYVLNLHGPSMTVDTMCSSSLTAFHLACQDLKHRRTDLAIAGGVNVTIHPNKYLMLSSGQFLSPQGHCESFGEGGDGYIPGEGVGVALLKRLVDAERDSDHIYGVIKGSAVNHGGKTNGYTVPNPNAQQMVIARALKEAQIDPRTISYIEAHGTGTKLGDPIEITGLTKAFRKSTPDNQYCWIGSAKSNIGHCESAAGIAGITKVLLQMQHSQIAPSLHSQVLNPHINFTATPFVVNQELRDWDRPVIDDQIISRIAGISSFGAGGSNAHVILEEYVEPQVEDNRSYESHEACCIVLSAKNEDRLREIVQNLSTYLVSPISPRTLSLHEVAYTLQVGREAMEERLAVMVRSLEELQEKLKGFLEGQDGMEDFYRGQVKGNQETLAVFTADEEFQETIEKWIKRGKYSKLLDLWVKGLVFDWNKLYGESKSRRISLPTYPFSRERHWISETGVHGSRFSAPVASAKAVPQSGIHGSEDRGLRRNLHPLVHENTSNVSELRFSSEFTGGEFFLEDHVAKGQRILPGVAYLEMAREAVTQATCEFSNGNQCLHLKNVVWARPISVGADPQEVKIGLFPEETGEIAYEIYTHAQNEEDEPLLHSQGVATLVASEQISTLNLGDLQARFNKHRLNPEYCYAAFKKEGIEYGPAHQGLAEIYVGDNEVLAKLTLPMCVSGIKDQFILHPSLLDSALQAAIGIVIGKEAPNGESQLSLPLALDRLEIIDHCSEPMWAWVSIAGDSNVMGNTGANIQKLDIDMCDEAGTICVRMKALSFQKMSQRLISQHSLPPLSLGETNYSEVVEKSRKISLRSLSDDQILSSKTESQSQVSITLSTPSTPNISTSQAVVKDKSITKTHIPASISAETLQEELTRSFAEILYMKRNDVDVDKKFTDMGLDSIVGVEWIRAINSKYGISIAATKIYDHPSIRQLAEFLKKELKESTPSSSLKELVTQLPEKRRMTERLPKSITLSTPNISTSQAVVQEKAKVMAPVRASTSAKTLQQALITSFAEALFMKRDEVDVDEKFINMGLDSVVGTEWVRAINNQYGISIAATTIYDYPNIRQLAEFLEKKLKEQRVGSKQIPLESIPSFSSKELVTQLSERRKIERLPNRFCQQGGAPYENLKRKASENGNGAREQMDISKRGDNYGLVLSTVHSLNEIRLQEWVVTDPDPDEVTIRVRASAINFPDTMCIKGLYLTMPDYPFVPGFEVSGVVSKVGSQISEFHVGDEVIALTGKQMGGHAGYVNVCETRVIPKPENISFEEGCSLPVVFGTVYYAFELGKLATKEHVLIQTATGGCGLLAIQLARLKECVCYGTSSRQEKLDILKALEIPYVFNYKTSEFDQEIRRITHNRGVDVVLNMLSGDSIQKGLNCLAHGGRYLEIAVHALKTSDKLDLSSLVQNQSIHSIDLRRLKSHNGFGTKNLLTLMVSLIQSQQIVPIVSRIYPIHQIKEALDYVDQGQHIGKVVISHTNQTMIDCTDYCIQRLIDHKRNYKRRRPNQNTTSSILFQRHEETAQEGVAVIGMSCQFPKSRTLAEFWDNLAKGRDCISEIPASRWSIDEYYDPDPQKFGKTYCKWMGVLEDVDRFDPLFFNISPAEATYMDPQQRLFLEICWRCIEDSGLNPDSLSGSKCGVFVGCAQSDYGQLLNGEALNAQGLMGGASSILSARISYFLNLKGPCQSIDTACSSSLVAMANACDSLMLGTSDLALAGGVCVLTGPRIHIMTSKAGMLSPNGRCFTFDQRADGFVPGEGVGVLLLKRLSDAVRDQDHINGIIRGWGVNQDGATNGITAPSVDSQKCLEKDVYQRFGIYPETISLVEAHGTGTKLGDPIEVEALTESFQFYTDRMNFCALGSVKSNIGHLLTAAGVSGVIKVLLALKHRQLPPSLHLKHANEHINFMDSPFYVNTELKHWEVKEGNVRRAAVSSFGFSGTNAHVVIEEWPPPAENLSDPSNQTNLSYLIVLSAKNEERLKEVAKNLHSYLTVNREPGTVNLHEVAYTLQVGREPMEERLAFIAQSAEDLQENLKGFGEGMENMADMYRGQVKRNKDTLAVFSADEELQEAIDKWIQRGKYSKLLDLWVKGLTLDWSKLYRESKPSRISLPTYPFAKERYWIPESTSNLHQASSNKHPAPKLHPLVHANTSIFEEQRFSSTFTGEEFFLKDHIVKRQRILPGVAYLEMAQEAVKRAVGKFSKDSQRLHLNNVVWARPIAVGEDPQEVHIRLLPEESGEIAYEIYTKHKSAEKEFLLHCQGMATLVASETVPQLNLGDLQAKLDEHHLNPEACYAAFKKMGIEFGPAHQGLAKMYGGDNEVLAKLTLPACVSGTKDPFILHPSLLDSALQASIGMGLGKESLNGESRPLLPFALDRLEIIDRCPESIWAWVRLQPDLGIETNTIATVQKLDIDLCDEGGHVCVKIRGFTSRVLEGGLDPGQGTNSSLKGSMEVPVGLITMSPVWTSISMEKIEVIPEKNTQIIIIGGTQEELKEIKQLYSQAKALKIDPHATIDAIAKQLEEQGSIDHLVWIASNNTVSLNSLGSPDIIQAQNQGVLQVFRIIKALLSLGYAVKDLAWTLITEQTQAVRSDNQVNPVHASVHGLIGSLAKEYPHWKIRLLDMDDSPWPIQEMFSLPYDARGNALAYRDKEWFSQELLPVRKLAMQGNLYKTGGVYVIIGGSGGIGEVWSRWMLQKYQAQIIWIGRREKDTAIQEKLDMLSKFGPVPTYVQADAVNRSR